MLGRQLCRMSGAPTGDVRRRTSHVLSRQPVKAVEKHVQALLSQAQGVVKAGEDLVVGDGVGLVPTVAPVPRGGAHFPDQLVPATDRQQQGAAPWPAGARGQAVAPLVVQYLARGGRADVLLVAV